MRVVRKTKECSEIQSKSFIFIIISNASTELRNYFIGTKDQELAQQSEEYSFYSSLTELCEAPETKALTGLGGYTQYVFCLNASADEAKQTMKNGTFHQIIEGAIPFSSLFATPKSGNRQVQMFSLSSKASTPTQTEKENPKTVSPSDETEKNFNPIKPGPR